MTATPQDNKRDEVAPREIPLDILLGFYAQQNAGLKHHETQRATITNLVVVVAGAIIGLQQYLSNSLVQHLLAAFVVALGAFGALLSAKHYQLSTRHGSLARAYREKIEAMNDICAIEHDKISAEIAKRLPKLSRLELWRLWVVFHLFIASLGVVLFFWK